MTSRHEIPALAGMMGEGARVAPVIETQRLILRPFRAGDLDAHAAVLADPDAARFIGGQQTREQAWRGMMISPGMWALVGCGFWAVERKADGRWIGQAGFGDFQRDITPGLDSWPEMGWIFAPGAHGQGYASEAVGAAIVWGERQFPAKDFSAIIDPRNTPSIRLAERHGFERRHETVYKDEPILIFIRPAPQA